MRREQDGPQLSLLVERAQKGDRAAWDRLVQNFANYVYSVPRRYGLSEDDCADVFQTTFQSLLGSLDRLESPNALPKWLAVTAARASLQLIRATKVANQKTADEPDLESLVASQEASAEEEAVRASSQHWIQTAILSLGGRCAPLLQALYLVEGASYDKVAKQLGIPSGAIGPTRARCLEKLRQSLEKQGFFV